MPVVPYDEASVHSPPPPSPPPPPNSSQWGPYSGAGDFGANMIVILVVLFCGLFLALAVNAIIRYLLCADRRRRRRQREPSDPEKPSLDGGAAAPAAESAPTQIFAAGTRLAGAGAAECAICLLEFADGDRVRVLPACEHGFHAACVERWLRAKSSCPTCRTTCQAAAAGPPAAAGA